MVGQLVVEDEYTINVKLRRPLHDGGCLPPPTITIIPDAPTVTITPPPHATLRQVQAAKSVNGAPPVRVGCARRHRQVASESHSPHLNIMPPPLLRRCQQEAPAPEEQVTLGCLPLVQVYADDNTLVATNKYLQPSGSPPLPVSPDDALAVPQGCQLAPGTLYVPRIPAHCKSDSGVLYVPPVEEDKLRVRKKEEPPAKGNSRRVKKSSSTVGQRQVASSATPPGRGARRSESSKAAARALLSEVLGSRLEARPPSPRPPFPRPFNSHLSSITNNQFTASNNQRNSAVDYNNLRNSAVDYNSQRNSAVDYNSQRNSAVDYNSQRNSAVDYNSQRNSAVDYNSQRNSAVDYNSQRNSGVDYNHNTVSSGHDASLNISFGTPSRTGQVVTRQ